MTNPWKIAFNKSFLFLLALIWVFASKINSIFSPSSNTINVSSLIQVSLWFLLLYLCVLVFFRFRESSHLLIKSLSYFLYSSIMLYIGVYLMVLKEFYYSAGDGADWTVLTIIVGWIIYLLLSLPIFVSLKNLKNENIFVIFTALLPQIIGLGIMVFITQTGRSIFRQYISIRLTK